MPTTLLEFIARWQASTLTEKAGSQPHFTQLCEVLRQPSPTEVDVKGTSYTFEKGAAKSGGGGGWADVWKRGFFGWEYKGKHKDLAAAYQQLLQYREDLENPPLLVVCDFDRFQVHTNFTGTVKRVYEFTLEDLKTNAPTPACPIPPLDVLRALFTAPDTLRPQQTVENVTEKAAAEFALLSQSLTKRGADSEQAAHFLMRLLFCLFAEDVALLPTRLFTRLVEQTRTRPEAFNSRIQQLFAAMSTGGSFGVEDIAHFNGGLFADDAALELTQPDMEVLLRAASLDWASVEPAIFGTLFERSLDPSKRSQLGAHYTSKEDILLIVEPVLMEPLRRRWDVVREEANAVIAKRDATTDRGARTRYDLSLDRLLRDFIDEITAVRVLDPACGSGNFLYVALKRLLDLEKEISIFAATNGLSGLLPNVDPAQLYGIEINPYAYELASVVVWIGYIQWLRDNGFGTPTSPILKPLHNIKRMDAILAYDEQGKPVEPEWPEADVIIGNPPFLGDKKMRAELGGEYVNSLRRLYEGRVPGGADLVTYWFERSRSLITESRAKRAGLLATQSIRAGANRRVLEHIKQTGDIFYAQADRPWILDGASVRVSMVGFDDGTEMYRLLNANKDDFAQMALTNARSVVSINANLTSDIDLTKAQRLRDNTGLCFQGPVKVGSFEIDEQTALQMLPAPNPNLKPNSDVIRPWVNASDITSRPRLMYIIDFNNMSLEEAAQYELPFEYVRRVVKPQRDTNGRARRREYWWQHGETVPGMRLALMGLQRVVCTPRVAKHRLFVWVAASTLPDSRLYVFARDDDYFFGVLHSRLHEIWSLATSSRHGVGNDPTYNNTTCFETYPFPWPPGHEPKDDPRVQAIAQAARELVEKRDAWLSPPAASETDLKKRTLTNLYNQRPTWLDLAHQTLDRAVLSAYGWPPTLTGEEILERLLALNLERAS